MSALTLALKRLNNSQLSANYATRLYRHIEEWGPQLRPPVYGLLARFASEGGILDQACGYLLKVPPSERKRVPLCEVAKRCVEMKRPDLVVSLLNGSPSLSPELVAHTIASFARSGLHAQALAYKSTLYHEMSAQARTLSWAFPFLLLSAAQSGRPGVARVLVNEMTDDWGLVPSELDFNLAVFAHLRACIAPSDTGRERGLSGSGGSEETAGLSELFGLLFRMKALGYGLHPIVRDFDLLHPSIPQSRKDLLGGVKMSMSLLKSVTQPSAVAHSVVAVDTAEALPATTPTPVIGQGRLLAPSTFLAITGDKLNLSPFLSLDPASPATSSASLLRSRAPLTEATPRDFFSLDYNREDPATSASSSSSTSIGGTDSEGESKGDSDSTGGRVGSAAELMSSTESTRRYPVEGPTLTAYPDLLKSSDLSPLDAMDYEDQMKALAISQAARKELLQSVTSGDDRGKSRVWTPTNMKNVSGSEAPQQESGLKKGKKVASWPLKPTYVPLAADLMADENEGMPGEGDVELDRIEDEGDMGGEGEGEGEGEIATGDYFQDNDWLDRKTKFVNFSDEEIRDMDLMEVLVPLSAPINSQADAASGLICSDSDSPELDPRSRQVLGRNTGKK